MMHTMQQNSLIQPLPVALAISSEQLSEVSKEFLETWNRSHGLTGAGATATTQGYQLTIEIDHALTQAEIDLAKTARGHLVVRKFLQSLVSEIYPELAHCIEFTLRCAVGHSHLDIAPAQNKVIFTIDLH